MDYQKLLTLSSDEITDYIMNLPIFEIRDLYQIAIDQPDSATRDTVLNMCEYFWRIKMNDYLKTLSILIVLCIIIFFIIY